MKRIFLNWFWVIVFSTIFFLPLLLIAQKPNYNNQILAEGKARIVFINSIIEEEVVLNLYARIPFFINDSLVCRITNDHYSVHDVVPGTYKLSVERAGRKLGKNSFHEIETLEGGEIIFYKFYNELGFLKDQSFFKPIKPTDAERLLQFINEEKKCIQSITTNPSVIENNKFYIQLQAGASNCVSDYRNWKNRLGDPLVTNFNPFTIGGEFGVRVGTDNHYLGFELYLNKQPVVEITPPFPNGEQRLIRLNQIGFLYRYFIKIDKKNKITLAPKIGLGLVNLEERTNNPSISDNTLEANSGFSFSLGIQPEYRFSKNISFTINTDYINGSIYTTQRDKHNLSSFRLSVGLKYQFNI